MSEQAIRNFINQQQRNPAYQQIIPHEHSNVESTINYENIHIHGNNPHTFYEQNSSTNTELEDFKNQVKIWMRLDNEIKEFTKQIKMLNNEIKQRKKYIENLTPFILSYMSSNEIEELNSKDGRLQCKVSMVKPPLSQKDLRLKLYNQFPNNAEDLDKIFKEREKVEKRSLRRLL